jgi:hypothetical protein
MTKHMTKVLMRKHDPDPGRQHYHQLCSQALQRSRTVIYLSGLTLCGSIYLVCVFKTDKENMPCRRCYLSGTAASVRNCTTPWLWREEATAVLLVHQALVDTCLAFQFLGSSGLLWCWADPVTGQVCSL